jgi:hypothetical protein
LYPQLNSVVSASPPADPAFDHPPGTQATIAHHSMSIVAELDARIVNVGKAAAIADSSHPVAVDHAEPVPGSPEPPD